MNKKVLISGAFMALLAVILGAFGSHGLKESLSQASMNSFETGLRYQMYHALMLLVVGSVNLFTKKQQRIILYLVVLGVVCFSLSIYLLSTSSIHGIDLSGIGLITPLGGLLLISAWVVFIVFLVRNKNH